MAWLKVMNDIIGSRLNDGSLSVHRLQNNFYRKQEASSDSQMFINVSMITESVGANFSIKAMFGFYSLTFN